jgi:hypothetical protein
VELFHLDAEMMFRVVASSMREEKRTTGDVLQRPQLLTRHQSGA